MTLFGISRRIKPLSDWLKKCWDKSTVDNGPAGGAGKTKLYLILAWRSTTKGCTNHFDGRVPQQREASYGSERQSGLVRIALLTKSACSNN